MILTEGCFLGNFECVVDWEGGKCFLGHLHLQAELGREPSLIQQKFTATVAAAYQHFDDQHGKSKIFCTDAISSFFCTVCATDAI